MTLELFILYLGYSFFVSCQNEHARKYYGTSIGFHNLLMASVLIGVLTGLVNLILLGFKVSWWIPLVFLGSAALLYIFLVPHNRNLQLLFSLIGFLGWPACAFLMYQSM